MLENKYAQLHTIYLLNWHGLPYRNSAQQGHFLTYAYLMLFFIAYICPTMPRQNYDTRILNFWSKVSDLVNEVIFNNTLDGSVAVFWLSQNPQCYLCMVWGKCDGGNHFCVAQHWWSVVIIVRHSLKAGFLHHLSLANSKCSNNRLYFIVCSQGYMSAMRKSYWTFYKSQIKYDTRKRKSKCIKILNVDLDQHRRESKCRHLLPVWLLAI